MISAYLTDPIEVKTLVSRDPAKMNKPTYSSVAVMARIEFQTKLVRNGKGEEVTAAAKVYLPKSVTPTHETRIVFDGVEHPVLSISRVGDFSISHWEVWIS